MHMSFSSRRRHTSSLRDLSSDVCSSDLCRFEWLKRGCSPTSKQFDGLLEILMEVKIWKFLQQGSGTQFLNPRRYCSAASETHVAWQIGRASCRERFYFSVVMMLLNAYVFFKQKTAYEFST